MSFALAVATLVGGGLSAGAATVESEALTAVPDGACGAAHDPDRDRDHMFHKRCEHYRHLHRYHRGKAANAHLAVRTMIDSQGSAVLEATTGTFDDGSVPPGVLEQLGVRIIAHADGKHRDDLTFKPRPAAGFFSTPIGHLVHGQALTVDAFISGIDRGNDHVSVDDTVQYRPDLAVGHIDVPGSVTQALPTTIAATVRETMGDLGATADCILSSDGAVVDRVTGMWVDAGGVVTCHFTHTFTAIGQHVLHVDVANVRPGDYDMSNNGGDATVVVAPQFMFSATAYDATYAGSDLTQVLDTAGNVLYAENNTFSGSIQSASINGSWGIPLVFPLATASARATSGGMTWSLVDLSNLTAASSDPTQGTCAAGSDATGFNWITVCTTGGNGVGSTNVNVSEFAGDITYHSVGVCQQTTSFLDCASGFTWNNGSTSAFATRNPFTGSLTVNLNLSDAMGTTLQAFPVVPLAPYTSQYDVPQTCEAQPDQTQDCFTHQYVEVGVKGSVTQ